MSSRRAPLPFFMLASILLLTACGPVRELSLDDRQDLDQEAQAQIAVGNFEAAAQIYLNQAADAEGPLVIQLRLDAGKTLLDGGLGERAREVIGPAAMAQADPKQRATARLLLARYFEAQGDWSTALDALGDPIPESDAEQRLRVLRLQARYQKALGASEQHLIARIRALPLLPLPEQAEETLAIWQDIEQGEAAYIETLAAYPQLQPWTDMAALLRAAALDSARLQTAIEDWTAQYAEHPATSPLAAHIWERFGAGGVMPTRIAILLPLTGRLGEAGAAIRDGILAAWYRRPVTERPAMDFHDTAAIPANNLYAQALGEGAEAIIGPLHKKELRLIALSGAPPIPMLALNRNPRIVDPPRNLFQFGLIPEDEAAATARRLIEENRLRALLFTPEGDRGDRVSRRFTAQYTEQGGTVLAENRFDSQQKDFSDAIQSALGLDLSRDRAHALMGLLGKRLKFEPRRRRDAQAIFLAAPGGQARLIKPQLAFHRADDIPVYALSRVYLGRPDPEADRDLDGVRFPDAPWMVGEGAMAAERSRMETDLPKQNPHYLRFHALGYDALNLLPRLTALRLASGQGVPAATGIVSSDAQGVLRRELVWAEFLHGAARLLAPTGETTNHANNANGVQAPNDANAQPNP